MWKTDVKRKLLKVISDNDGQWGWYQFERAFPPGWFKDAPADLRIMTIIFELERDGLIQQVPAEPQARYALTEQGREEVAVHS